MIEKVQKSFINEAENSGSVLMDIWLLSVLKHNSQILPEPNFDSFSHQQGLCAAQLQRIYVAFKTILHTRHI